MSTHNTYTIAQLKKLATEQNYKFACLFDNKDKKVNNFNTLQTPISKQFTIIENRLKSPALADGIYFVGMCEKYGRGQIVDKYPIIKGSNLAENGHSYTILQPQQTHATENVLSYESALAMQKENAKLENRVQLLEAQNVLLQEKIDELEEDLKESTTSLSEYVDGNGNPKTNPLAEMGKNAGAWFKDVAPMFAPIADRYFDLKEKQIGLEEKKLDIKKGIHKQPAKKMEEKKIAVGSDEFLNYIRKLHKEEEEEELNKCLDLLEQNFPEQYNDICEELDFFEEEEEEEGK